MPNTKGFTLFSHPDWHEVLEPYYCDDRDPKDISAGSHSYIQIVCPECGEEREIPARLAIQGRLRCKPCAMKKAPRSWNRRGTLTELDNWDDVFSYLYADEKDPSKIRQASSVMIDVVCPVCGNSKRVSAHNWSRGQILCSICSANTTCKLDETESWEENKQWYRDERDPHTIPQSSQAIRIQVECPKCGEINEITPFAFYQKKLRHSVCKRNGRTPDHFLDEDPAWESIKPFYADEADPHTIAANGNRYVKLKCYSCGRIYSARINHLVNHKTPCCPECAHFYPRTGSCFLTEAPEWESIKDAYLDEKDPSTLSRGSSQEVLVECPKCHRQKRMQVNSFRKTGGYCWTCGRGEPHLERNIRELLWKIRTSMSDNQLRCKEQWPYPIQTWRKSYTADVAIFREHERLPVAIIECQGKQHDHPIEFFGGQVSFEKQLVRDLRKRAWCKDSNIPLLEIPYEHRDDGYQDDVIKFIADNLSIPEDELWVCLQSDADDSDLPFDRDLWQAKRR